MKNHVNIDLNLLLVIVFTVFVGAFLKKEKIGETILKIHLVNFISEFFMTSLSKR